MRSGPGDCCLQLLFTEGLCRGPAERVLADALRGGVDLVQVREKQSDRSRLAEVTRRVLGIAGPLGIPVLVNDDLDVAATLPVQGVHLGQGDRPIEEARRRLGPEAWIGLSTHGEAEVRAASGATHLGLGACFQTSTKADHRVLGREELRRAVAAATLPLFAIGGIDPGNVSELLALGIRRLAVSSCILTSEDPASVAARLREALARE